MVLLVWFVTLLGASSAEAVPSVTYKCTPAPEDCNGWFRSDVSIDWTVIPSDAAVTGCQDKTFTADTPGTNEFCSADDGAANVTVQLRIRVDQTAPVVTGGAPERPADVDGWYNRAVSVTFDGSDLTSGVDSCTNTTYGGPDSGAASVAGTCTDKAGNVSTPFPYGLKYDETAPAVTRATPDRPANANGWFNRAVRFDVEGADATSGIADCPFETYSGPDSATGSVTGTCRDRAGNSATRAFALMYDATAPVAAARQAARPPDVNGWYNRPVGVEFGGGDQLSGVESCTRPMYAGPDGAAASATGTCTDLAGNVSAPATFALKYDATTPVVTGGVPARAADLDGWYNHAVEVGFAGSDQTAGIEACTTATYTGPDDAAGSLAGTCTDRAGNVSNPLGYGLKYDGTAPVVTGAVPDRAANPAGWFNRSVGFSISGTDATSGIAACPAVSYAGPDSATASVVGACRDRAGNSASQPFPLKYDAAAPTVTAGRPARPPDLNGWYNRTVGVGFSGSDRLSGVASCSSESYSGPDSATASVAGTCTDQAGNVSVPFTHRLQYDASAPQVTGGAPARSADANGWYNHAVSVAFSGTDPVSGVDGCTSAAYDGPDSAAASVGGTCRDRAGNVSSPQAFRLSYDATDPAVTAGRPARPADFGGWYNRAVAFDFSGADATSGIAGCPSVTYTGPDTEVASVRGTCLDRAGNSAERAFPLKYDGTAPEVSGATPDRPPNADGWYNRPVALTFDGSDAMSGIGGCTTGTYVGPDSAAASVTGTCTDRAGNVSGTRPFALKYDATAPAVSGGAPARGPDSNGWYNRPVSVAFAGTDQTSGVAGCTSVAYGGPDSGAASVSGTCDDRAGNSSGPLPFALKYDATGPEVTAAIAERPPDHAGWYVSPVRFDFTGRDTTSGVDTCPAVTYAGPDAGGAVVAGRCRDRAGNSSIRAFPLDYDATAPPLTDLTATGADRSLFVSWRTSEDARSVEVLRTPGIGTELKSGVFGGPGTSFTDRRVENGVRYSYEVRLRDAAGNARVGTVSGIPAVPEPVPVVPVAPVAPPELAPPGAAPAPVVLTPAPPRIAPSAGAVFMVGKPPLLEWPPAQRARYYNVQLFRGGRKILTVWPTVARYQLKMRWTYRGRRWRLSPGRYRWVVWPGYGPRAKADYGKRIAASTFVIRRAP